MTEVSATPWSRHIERIRYIIKNKKEIDRQLLAQHAGRPPLQMHAKDIDRALATLFDSGEVRVELGGKTGSKRMYFWNG